MKCGEKALNISSKESTLVPSPCLDRHIPHNKLLLTIWKGQKSKEWQNLKQTILVQLAHTLPSSPYV